MYLFTIWQSYGTSFFLLQFHRFILFEGVPFFDLVLMVLFMNLWLLLMPLFIIFSNKTHFGSCAICCLYCHLTCFIVAQTFANLFFKCFSFRCIFSHSRCFSCVACFIDCFYTCRPASNNFACSSRHIRNLNNPCI